VTKNKTWNQRKDNPGEKSRKAKKGDQEAQSDEVEQAKKK